MKNVQKEVKSEISLLRNNLYLLLDCDNNDKSTILKASAALDRAILKYIKNVKQ